jgi:hypothetical protein
MMHNTGLAWGCQIEEVMEFCLHVRVDGHAPPAREAVPIRGDKPK